MNKNITSLESKVLYVLCRHCVSVMDGCYPYPSTRIAKRLDISKSQAYYLLKKLKEKGLVESFKIGGRTEEGVYCLRGFKITEKAYNTEEYKLAYDEEVKINKKYFQY